MNTRQQLKQQFGTRTAVITAAVAGFLVGAGGFAAAQIGPESTPAASATVEASSTLDVSARRRSDPLRPTASAALTGSVVTKGGVTLSIDDSTSTSVPDDSSSTSIPDTSSTVPNSIPDDSTSTSTPDTSTTVPNSIPDTSTTVPNSIPDDSTSTSTPDTSTTVPNSIPDDSSSTSTPDTSTTVPNSIPDDSTSTSIPDTSSTVPNSTVAPLPGPFTETYSSAGGSITVSWSGTAFSLLAVDAAAGFHAEIEDHAWDRIRVDFEGDDDARVEVRLNDGRIRVRID